jgi:glycerol-3-phosphate dehydrogenase
LEPVGGTETLWAELRWAARAEAVAHLEDLLLRRVRLGHLLPKGGAEFLPRIRAICQPELGWDDRRWTSEEAAYLELWRCCYSLPEPSAIPDWRAALAEARSERQAALQPYRRRVIRRSALAGLLLALAATVAFLFLRRRSQDRDQDQRQLERQAGSRLEAA